MTITLQEMLITSTITFAFLAKPPASLGMRPGMVLLEERRCRLLALLMLLAGFTHCFTQFPFKSPFKEKHLRALLDGQDILEPINEFPRFADDLVIYVLRLLEKRFKLGRVCSVANKPLYLVQNLIPLLSE